MARLQEKTAVDWTDCPLVEINPHKVSGAPILRGTRVQADSIFENYEGGETVEDISDNFDIPQTTIRKLSTFASFKRKQQQA